MQALSTLVASSCICRHQEEDDRGKSGLRTRAVPSKPSWWHFRVGFPFFLEYFKELR
jgi:hypothetical protein